MIRSLFICIIVFSALLISCSSNIITSIFSFIGIIIGLVYLLLGSSVEFLSLIFLIIYVGAIIVLFLFVIFIIDLSNSNLNSSLVRNSVKTVFGYKTELLKLFFILFFFKFISFPFIYSLDLLYSLDSLYYSNFLYLPEIFFFFQMNDIDLIGFLLYTQYGGHLILTGLILLIAIIGSVLLVTYKVK